jgi:hypothetical protein
MSVVEGEIDTNKITNESNIKKSHSTTDLERASPLPSASSDMAASLNKLLILSNPNLRKSQPLDDSSSKSESPTIEEQHINLVVPSPAPSPAGVESN